MKTSTKLIALGSLGAAAAAFGAAHRFRRRAKATNVDSLFDASDVQDTSGVRDAEDVEIPMIVTEEVIVITEPDYDDGIDLIPSDDPRVRR